MPTSRRHRYVRLQVTWLLGALLALVTLGAFSPGAFFLLAVLGFVVLNELLIPAEVDPRWRGRIRRLTVVAIAGAAVVVAVRTIQLIAPGVLP